MNTKKIFLASSSELKEDREQFEIFINRKNKDWVEKGVFLKLIVWEDFLDALSQTRLQNEYNKAIQECDLFVMLFCTKVGQYTEEEFETAFKHFKSTNKPFIFTYFKDAQISTGTANKLDLMSLWAFQAKLDELGHFYTRYKSIDELKLHFNGQLDKLVANGFIEFEPDQDEVAAKALTAVLSILISDYDGAPAKKKAEIEATVMKQFSLMQKHFDMTDRVYSFYIKSCIHEKRILTIGEFCTDITRLIKGHEDYAGDIFIWCLKGVAAQTPSK